MHTCSGMDENARVFVASEPHHNHHHHHLKPLGSQVDFFFVLTSLVLVCGRTMLLHTLREQRGDAASAGYGSTGGMSSSCCKCSWPRVITTPPHGDRAGPGAGGRHEMYYTAAGSAACCGTSFRACT